MTRANGVRPAAHSRGQLYPYVFLVYRDNGIDEDMTFLGVRAGVGTDRIDARRNLPLAPHERTIPTTQV